MYPKQMTAQDFAAALGHGRYDLLPLDDNLVAVEGPLDDIAAWLKRFEAWGLNPKGVKLDEFEAFAYLPKVDRTPAGFADFGPLMLFKHRKTGEVQDGVQAIPPRGRRMPSFHYATAARLIDLAG